MKSRSGAALATERASLRSCNMAWGDVAGEIIGHVFEAAFWTYDSHLTLQGWLTILGVGAVVGAIVLFFTGRMELGFVVLGVGLVLFLSAWLVDRRDERHPFA